MRGDLGNRNLKIRGHDLTMDKSASLPGGQGLKIKGHSLPDVFHGLIKSLALGATSIKLRAISIIPKFIFFDNRIQIICLHKFSPAKGL
ncbi:MAG: hypothetical protein A2487_18975 [Candidatus Raymondbacteria bacterium RifOxyC12_full_50_8]|uniref:Uncharacterized protein n=1 Tax=Candidatus Raymondbacteria bacterium RIFOXYD12_FULL_49_13 TaxID=1817890 RepID=A0A1F7F9H2_UNCRA|nr:MAG: hypothetical protein A2350_06770 [Candidatus Raymondbacteria bacterium RifOxyB12_full_50_8]OGJ93222.1 MAG: hypothetical protein A2248_17790 [Candidatus Raymondbacteria bacterium RIFOXYA2_FULL_49_16]OGK03305.1 MAG: hypothetical protein A2519_15135 [Candidatus Raymondbacteria bacterium RIFOXYD12_FULL_49_13]OGK07422.1 MAG: hypothetical protein A2487_18975 [Candidatus Raymondbacteria bacterium RifOxyC12_full_50_8]OGP44944.1 MAG: hypothetical protein A2324_19715 [Candidatus Raymondbacteria b